MTGITARVVTMSPSRAADLLTRNTINRPPREAWVAYLAERIAANEWHLTQDAIAVDVEGNLANGQHRLSAIVRAGKSVSVLLMEGLPVDTMAVIDRGIVRTQADNLRLPKELVADSLLISNLLGERAGRRIPEERIVEIQDWWKPAYDKVMQTTNGRKFGGLTNSGIRIAIGLRWAIAKDMSERDYIITNYAHALATNVGELSTAFASLWRRVNTTKFAGSLEGRILLTATAFHFTDPARRDAEPLLRSAFDVRSEIAGWLALMADAYTAGPSKDGHPFVFATRPAFVRKVTPAKAVKVVKLRRAA